MCVFNAATVIRLTSKPILSAFFEREGCMNGIDFNRTTLYEIQEMFGALPDSVRHRIDPILKGVYDIAHSTATMTSIIDELKEYHGLDERDIRSEFFLLKNKYDQGFFVQMNCPDVWKRHAEFAPVDSLPPRYWTRFNGLPRRTPLKDNAALQNLGQLVSDYYMSKQIRGKHYLVDYAARTESDHYFYLNLSDYSNKYGVWAGGSDTLTTRIESRPFNMVLEYNETYGTLNVFARGGKEISQMLNESFSKAILNHEVTSSRTIKDAFRIDHLIHRENMLKPMPELGVEKVTIYSVELTLNDNGKRFVSTQSIDRNTRGNDDMYNTLESCALYGQKKTRPRLIKIALEMNVDGIRREMIIELTRNSCALRSNSEDLRQIGEEYLRRSGIDEQPELI